MTKLFEVAVESARNPARNAGRYCARRSDILAGQEQPTIQLTQNEEASFAESRAQAARREFATEEDIKAVWSKHGL